jgi:arylformamidase
MAEIGKRHNMLYFNELYDISVTLGKESIVYPGDPLFTREVVSSIADGQLCELSKLSLCAHSGTHIDAPSHFIKDAKTIEQYPLSKFILPAQVIEILDPEAIKLKELERKKIKASHALLFKTANSLTGRVISGTFSKNYVYLSSEAAQLCLEKKAPLVGLDYLSLDMYGSKDCPAHRKLMVQDVLILESINLKEVPEGEYTLFCFPLKILNAEGAPVRAVLAR